MKLNVQVWMFINTSVYEIFVVSRNTLGIKQGNGESSKIVFTSDFQSHFGRGKTGGGTELVRLGFVSF